MLIEHQIRVEFLGLFLWLFFSAYWIVSSRFIKQKVAKLGQDKWYLHVYIRYLVIVLVVLQFILLQKEFTFTIFDISNGWVLVVGLVLFVGGISLAIWSRWVLGRDWDSAPTIKQNHALIMRGPYQYIRHPIYLGILLALLGSAILYGVTWFIVFIFYACVYVHKMREEERLLEKKFPNEYLLYKQRTWLLFPGW